MRLGLGFALRLAISGWGFGVCVVVCALLLYPVTPGWGVRRGFVCLGSVSAAPRHSWRGCWGVFVCSRARSACTPPLLAGVCGVVVYTWAGPFGCALPLLAGVLGCVCVFVGALRLYLATAAWGVRCGSVCLGSDFGCAPPNLAGMLGCVCFCERSACTPPLLAGPCGVGVGAWAQVSAAPRHSWLVCLVVFVFVGALRLYPATPGRGVRCGCAFLGSGFRCASPLLAGLLGCVCVCERSACTPPLLARMCGVAVAAWAPVWAAPRHSWLGRSGVFVFVGALRLYPATPGWGVPCGCLCFGSDFVCTPPLLAGAFGCVCVCGRAPLVPRHSWVGCGAWVCVYGLGFGLRPATPGWGARVCVCLLARSACTPPLLARVCGVGVCAWARVSAAPRHSCNVGVCLCLWACPACTTPLLAGVCGVDVCALARILAARRQSWLGCWGASVFAGAPRLYPATRGLGVRCGCVCLDTGSGCAPPLLAGVLGCVCVCGRAPRVRRHSWLQCAVQLCVRGLGFRLSPATPGSGVGVCVCLCASSACTPPLLAGVCGVRVCALARVSAAPRHSWLGCWVVCVLVGALRLNPATPWWGVRCGCVPWAQVSAAPRRSWLGCWGVCVCLWARSACKAPLLAAVCGTVVCAWARVSAAPCNSSLGCWGVCVFVCELRL